MTRRDRTYRMPSIRFAQTDACAPVQRGLRRDLSVARMTTTSSSANALPQNASPRPPAAIAAPAIAGPMMRDRLNWAELRATALPIAARSTRLATIAW